MVVKDFDHVFAATSLNMAHVLKSSYLKYLFCYELFMFRGVAALSEAIHQWNELKNPSAKRSAEEEDQGFPFLQKIWL
jgi:hypothetical protein